MLVSLPYVLGAYVRTYDMHLPKCINEPPMNILSDLKETLISRAIFARTLFEKMHKNYMGKIYF